MSLRKKTQNPMLHDEAQDLLFVWCHHVCHLTHCICVISQIIKQASVGLRGARTQALLSHCCYCQEQMLTLSLTAQPHSRLKLQLFMCFKMQEKIGIKLLFSEFTLALGKLQSLKISSAFLQQQGKGFLADSLDQITDVLHFSCLFCRSRTIQEQKGQHLGG